MPPLPLVPVYADETDATRIALTGGLIFGASVALAGREGAEPAAQDKPDQWRMENIRRARTERLRAGGSLPIFAALLGVRLDLCWYFDPASGFDPSWLLTQPTADLSRVLTRWQAAGWRVEWDAAALGRPVTVDPQWFFAHWMRSSPRLSEVPVIYWSLDASARVIWPRALVVDLRVPAYQAWAVERALLAQRLYGADGIEVGLKTGRMASPQTMRTVPEGTEELDAASGAWSLRDADVRGPTILCGSLFGGEEYAAAYTAMLLALSERAAVVVNEAPGPFSRQSAWLSEGALAGRLLGELTQVHA